MPPVVKTVACMHTFSAQAAVWGGGRELASILIVSSFQPPSASVPFRLSLFLCTGTGCCRVSIKLCCLTYSAPAHIPPLPSLLSFASAPGAAGPVRVRAAHSLPLQWGARGDVRRVGLWPGGDSGGQPPRPPPRLQRQARRLRHAGARGWLVCVGGVPAFDQGVPTPFVQTPFTCLLCRRLL